MKSNKNMIQDSLKSDKILDIIVWLLIFIAGLFAAFVCFKILSSTGEGKFQGYTLGGGIVGALVSWTMLTTLYLQIRRSSNELEKLKIENADLKQKVIRGTPCPVDFEVEVSERQKIVLSRPKEWKPKGGTILDLVLPKVKMKDNDLFPPIFNCHHIPIVEGITPEMNKYYEAEIESCEQATEYVNSYNHEFITIGGEQSPIKALKIIAKQFAHIEYKKSKFSNQKEIEWYPILREQFTGIIHTTEPSILYEKECPYLILRASYLRSGVKCYIDDKERKIHVKKTNYDFMVLVEIDKSDIHFKKAINIYLVNPEVKNIREGRSNYVTVPIIFEEDPKKNEIIDLKKYFEDSEGTIIENLNDEIIKDKSIGKNRISRSELEDKEYFTEIIVMRLVCYHIQLANIYWFIFIDDSANFDESSSNFNQIINTIRFLN